MPAICGVCSAVCLDDKCVKCAGICGKSFHTQCVKIDGVKTRTANKEWKCEECARGKESSVASSKSSASSTAVTKEFMIGVLESFKKEVFNEMKQHLNQMNDGVLEPFKKDVLKEIKQHSNQMDDFRTSVEFLSKSMDEAKVIMTAIRKDYADLKKQNEELRLKNGELTETVDNLKERVRELEQYSRRNNIEISGVPATAKENTLALVKDIGAAIGQQVEESQLMAAHRVPSFNSRRDPSLVIQFQNRMVRDKWLSSYREKRTLLANEVNPNFTANRVFINEHLSQENKLFLRKLKLKCKDSGFKYVWFREGKFFIRKSDGEKCHRVVKLQDLGKFM